MKYKPSDGVMAEKLQERFEEGREAERRSAGTKAHLLERATTDLNQLLETVRTFEQASGLHIRGWTGNRIGEQVRKYHDAIAIPSEAERLAQQLEAKAQHLTSAVEMIRKACEEPKDTQMSLLEEEE
jgi:hypothetical protein